VLVYKLDYVRANLLNDVISKCLDFSYNSIQLIGRLLPPSDMSDENQNMKPDENVAEPSSVSGSGTVADTKANDNSVVTGHDPEVMDVDTSEEPPYIHSDTSENVDGLDDSDTNSVHSAGSYDDDDDEGIFADDPYDVTEEEEQHKEEETVIDFSYSWVIKDFNHIVHSANPGDILWSSRFPRTRPDIRTRWKLKMYPAGCDQKSPFSLYLMLVSSETPKLNVSFALEFLDADYQLASRHYMIDKEFNVNKGWGWRSLLTPRNTEFDEGIAIIRCRIRQYPVLNHFMDIAEPRTTIGQYTKGLRTQNNNNIQNSTNNKSLSNNDNWQVTGGSAGGSIQQNAIQNLAYIFSKCASADQNLPLSSLPDILRNLTQGDVFSLGLCASNEGLSSTTSTDESRLNSSETIQSTPVDVKLSNSEDTTVTTDEQSGQ